MINELMRRRALLMARQLPYDAEIAYLGGTGTQYINSGIIGGSGTTYEVQVNLSSTSGIIGARQDTNTRTAWALVDNTMTQLGYGNSYLNVQGSYLGSLITIKSYIGSSYFVDIEKAGSLNSVNFNLRTFTCNQPIYIMGINNSGSLFSSYIFRGNMYYCKIWDNDTLVRDFIPVRVEQVGYMYDKVSGQLFGNAGSGNFILGNDIN